MTHEIGRCLDGANAWISFSSVSNTWCFYFSSEFDSSFLWLPNTLPFGETWFRSVKDGISRLNFCFRNVFQVVIWPGWANRTSSRKGEEKKNRKSFYILSLPLSLSFQAVAVENSLCHTKVKIAIAVCWSRSIGITYCLQMGNTTTTEKSPKAADDYQDTSWMEAIEKSCVFVWCDTSIGQRPTVNDDKHTIMQLAHVVNRNRQLVHTFNDLKACREFITHVNNVCLITSGSMGQELVPSIHNLDQVHSIYIFCLNKTKHELWSKPYQKVRGVFTDIKNVCDLLKSYFSSRSSLDYDRLEFDVISKPVNASNNDQQEIILIYAKLSKMILLNMDSPDHGKKDMVQYCRSEYTSDYQVRLINEFDRNYSQHHPFWWYTRDHFFQGIVNNALRTHDLYTVCSMYRFLKDIDGHLTQLHNSQAESNEPLMLYFGQFISKNDFIRIKDNCGALMSINQFVSANPEQSIAVMFIREPNASHDQGKNVRVLFQISIDRDTQSNVAYANIGAISQFVHEKEHLISMGSIYRIDAIEKLVDLSSGWHVHLTLISRHDWQYNLLTQCIQKDQWEEEVNLSELGYKIMNQLHQFKLANKLFKQALKSQKLEFRYLMLHFNMAVVLGAMNEHEKALEEYRYALSSARHYIPTCYNQDDLCLIPLYGNMACTYQHANRFTNAVEHAFRALGIISKGPIDSNLKRELIAACYQTMGNIHDQDGKYTDARNFYEQALKVRQSYLPLGHPDITVLQRHITLLVNKRSDGDRADERWWTIIITRHWSVYFLRFLFFCNWSIDGYCKSCIHFYEHFSHGEWNRSSRLSNWYFHSSTWTHSWLKHEREES